MDWIEIVSMVASLVLVPILGFAINALCDYFKTKADNERMNKYFDLFRDAVTKAVQTTASEFVDSLKKYGGWTEEAKAQAFAMSKQELMKIVNATTLQAVTNVVGDIDSYIKDAIETEVRADPAKIVLKHAEVSDINE